MGNEVMNYTSVVKPTCSLGIKFMWSGENRSKFLDVNFADDMKYNDSNIILI